MNNLRNSMPDCVYQPQFIDGHALSIPTFSLLQADGCLFPRASAPNLNREQALKIYHSMVFIRILDERMLAAQRQGRISFYLQCLGEEATTVASAAALDDKDMIMAQYREQGALHYRGFSLTQFMDQLLSNEHDLGKGRQMPVHYGSKALHYMTISSPLGTQIPQASGYAYGQKLRGEPNITLCYFGEGAASVGDFHAGLNMAAVLKAPVIFFCRNNGYAISTPAHEQYISDGIASRGVGYGIPAIRVDGADALAVYEATRLARELALSGQQPVLIEAMAYRLGAHSSSDDPSGYRSRDEETRWRSQDPIARYRRWLLQQDWLDEAADQLASDVLRQEVLEALKIAEKIAKPHIDTLITDVYAQPTDLLHSQLAQLKAHIRRFPEAYPLSAARCK